MTSGGFEKWGPNLTPEQQSRLELLLSGFVSIYQPVDAWLLMRVVREQRAELTRVRQLEQALGFYAEYDNYRGCDDGTSKIGDDAGETARAALSTMPEK